MSDANQRLGLHVSLAIKSFMETMPDPPPEFHTLEMHSMLCAGRLAEDRDQCDCSPIIEVHVGFHRDCLSCRVCH